MVLALKLGLKIKVDLLARSLLTISTAREDSTGQMEATTKVTSKMESFTEKESTTSPIRKRLTSELLFKASFRARVKKSGPTVGNMSAILSMERKMAKELKSCQARNNTQVSGQTT